VDQPNLMELSDADNAILLVVDIQGKIAKMVQGGEALRTLVAKLLRVAELFDVPVVVTEQYPKGLGKTVSELAGLIEQINLEKHLFSKSYFGCCGEPGFDKLMAVVADGVRERRRSGANRPVDVVVVGIETHVCVQQTVLELLPQGFRVILLEDCTSSRTAACRRIALERMRQCGVLISCFESIAFEWARTKDHPRFKEMSAIIKEEG
jgi:nicotinamidase-related amidase